MHVQTITKSEYLTPLFAWQCNAVCPFRLLELTVHGISKLSQLSFFLSFSLSFFLSLILDFQTNTGGKWLFEKAFLSKSNRSLERRRTKRKTQQTIVINKHTHIKKPHPLSAATTAGIFPAVTQIIRAHWHTQRYPAPLPDPTCL